MRVPGKNLRTGFTTGACAAAATKAACIALQKRQTVSDVDIKLPGGQSASFQTSGCSFEGNSAQCSVIKDAGDDPDVTNGAEICSRVFWTEETGVNLRGGEGVGVVTRPGLGLAIGSPAINPVPRQMIMISVRDVLGVLPSNRGLEVVISVPGGEKIARRTLNPRLGIVGGISILGTTGIVIPYSLEAYNACITQALQVARATGQKEVVLTSGRQSEKYAQSRLSLPEVSYIQMGDQLYFALEECARIGFGKVQFWGMIGKLSKVAAGHLRTHYTRSSVDIDFLLGLALNTGAGKVNLEDLKTAETARDFLEKAKGYNIPGFFTEICRLAAISCSEHVSRAFSIECVLVDYEGEVLGKYNT